MVSGVIQWRRDDGQPFVPLKFPAIQTTQALASCSHFSPAAWRHLWSEPLTSAASRSSPLSRRWSWQSRRPTPVPESSFRLARRCPSAPVVVAPRVIPPPYAYGMVWRPGYYNWTGYGYAMVPGAVGAAALCTRGLDRAAVGARATRRVLGTRVLAALRRYRAPRPRARLRTRAFVVAAMRRLPPL